MARKAGSIVHEVGILLIAAVLCLWAGGAVVWGGEGESTALEEGSRRADDEEVDRMLEQLREMRKEREARSGIASTPCSAEASESIQRDGDQETGETPALPSVVERPEWDELIARINREDGIREEAERLDAVRNPKPGSITLTDLRSPPFPEKPITILSDDQYLGTICERICQESGVTIRPYGEAVSVRMAICAEAMPVEHLLALISRTEGLVWWREDDGEFGVADRRYYERYVLPGGHGIQKVFRLKHIKPSEAQSGVRKLMTPNRGSAVGDDRTMKMIVNDEPAGIERVKRFLAEVDKPAVE